ncbi:peptidylglycine alpha-hydroxylating monooxygenase [Hyposmocoma kahamanoa]|uniref:peptidylglycine alpha-hydroxylating monooxygenase n=1 Tax=Hyposmocoma kahamanoa TaxID=1477025 RepID=UPI000E6D88C1|nr:peptidylglycine alpha-hydroxylating monooxygenase [Hyposmocoma kahamanoa]
MLIYAGFLILMVGSVFGASKTVDTYPFLMPKVWPFADELYLCTPIRIAPRTSYYIVGFEPNATMHTAHHMLIYGCTEPGTNDTVWDCGEMQSNNVDYKYASANPCRSGSQVRIIITFCLKKGLKRSVYLYTKNHQYLFSCLSVTTPTNKDEMCNFYLMYWVENDTPLEQKYCFSVGPPYYDWSVAPEAFNTIPDREASIL